MIERARLFAPEYAIDAHADAARERFAVVADLDLGLIDEVRQTWQFYRDRRPEAYAELVKF
jgi:N-carbamoylputrescine amidase